MLSDHNPITCCLKTGNSSKHQAQTHGGDLRPKEKYIYGGGGGGNTKEKYMLNMTSEEVQQDLMNFCNNVNSDPDTALLELMQIIHRVAKDTVLPGAATRCHPALQHVVTRRCNTLSPGAATRCHPALQHGVTRRCNTVSPGAATRCHPALQHGVTRRCNTVSPGAATWCNTVSPGAATWCNTV